MILDPSVFKESIIMNSEYSFPKIAIIGAGLAGLASAYYLSKKGYDVEVFEARKRVGGRVHSVLMENLEGGGVNC